jgi:3D-(3,5/4)-trihydroxycyclohexane-1,2-dione acylhydrolase (decyclizing)
MQLSEIVTAAQERLKVTIVVSDNHGFQVICHLQLERVGRSFGNEFRYRTEGPFEGLLEGEYLRLDLASVARGLGATAIRASGSADVLQALKKAREERGPVVVVVPTAPYVNLPPSQAWWDVAPAEVSRQEWVNAARLRYEQERRLQRWYG